MEMAENTFPSGSLETSMTRHWAAACGLLTGDGRIRQRGRELLAVNQPTAARFGRGPAQPAVRRRRRPERGRPRRTPSPTRGP